MDLNEFINANPARSNTLSWIETLPEDTQEQLLNARAQGAGWNVMLRWLESEGITDASIGKLKNGIQKLVTQRTRNPEA
jgi:hypothetical protein